MTREEIIKPENLVYKKPTLMNDNPMHYCPGCSHGVVHKLIAEVIDAGCAKHAASGSIRLEKSVVSQSATSSATPSGAFLNSFRHCSNIQSPHMFLRNLVVPSIPPSFVKLCLKLSCVIMASGVSIPRRDHVPQLIKAKSFSRLGTAVTADCVS